MNLRLPSSLRLIPFILLLSLAAAACGESGGEAGLGTGGNGGTGGGTSVECDFDSTFAAIQSTVFEAQGCASNACHGESYTSSGNLDLRAGASYASLVRIPSSVNDELERVFPGDQDLSLLYRKVTESTESLAAEGLGQSMPVVGDALSDDQRRAIAAWIRAGAPETGIVEGTLQQLGCSGNFVADPNKIDPLPEPDAAEGIQFYSGGWALGAEAEDEVCFATYYDFTDLVPPDYRVPCDEFGEGRECFAFGRNELAQDAQSHHSIINVYTPESDPNGPDWGPWACLGGDRAGEPCEPGNREACGARSACTTPVQTSVACVGYPYAPRDFSVGAGAIAGGGGDKQVALSGAQESTRIDLPPEGVYSRLPLTGFISWNSHGFNLTTKDTTIEQWVNLSYVPQSGRQWLNRQIFESQEIFSMSPIAPFAKKEVCMTFTLPQYARLTSLSSHMHERGEEFRIWLPPNEPCDGIDCAAAERDPDYVSRLYDDPVYTYYEPALEYDGDSEPDRTFKACARYDNGADDPAEVKRESTKPNTPTCSFPLAHCGCAPNQRACVGGPNQGESCNGDDAACGEGGLCDACPVRGGITTVDEMFIPLGTYYVRPPSP